MDDEVSVQVLQIGRKSLPTPTTCSNGGAAFTSTVFSDPSPTAVRVDHFAIKGVRIQQ
jgi:hypothetical protein